MSLEVQTPTLALWTQNQKTGKAGVQTLQRCGKVSFVRGRAPTAREGRPFLHPGHSLSTYSASAAEASVTGSVATELRCSFSHGSGGFPQRPWGRIRPASSCCQGLWRLRACGCVTPHLPSEARGAVPASLRPRPKSPFYQDTSPCPGPTLIVSAEAGTHSWQGLGVAHSFVGEHSSCCSQQTAVAFSDSEMLGLGS